MPYSGPKDPNLPEHVKKLPESKRRQWIAVYESSRENGDDEGTAMQKANGVVASAPNDKGTAMRTLMAANPVDAKVVSVREDGSGGVVAIPILSTHDYIDFGKTQGGGGVGSIPRSDLQQMAENFPRYPGPVTVGTEDHDRDIAGKSPGFYQRVWLEGNDLWAEIDMGPQLFQEVVRERAWRAFSIEAKKNLKKSTVNFDGWVLTGGIFVNDPGTRNHFRIAASGADESSSETMQVHSTIWPRAGKEPTMADDNPNVELAQLRARSEENDKEIQALTEKLKTERDERSTLTEENKKLSARVETAEADAVEAKATAERKALAAKDAEKEIEQRDSTIKELRGKLKDSQTANRAVEIKDRILKAIQDGVKPAFFDGIKGDIKESTAADFVAWFDENYVSMEAFDRTLAALPREKTDRLVRSGKDADLSTKTDPEVAAKLRGIGLDPKYAEVENEAQARELSAKK